jgi:5-methylcytosine-specific restriction endonuclease McrA
VLKEISRRLALGIDLPPEALAYAKGQSLDAPNIYAPKQAASKKPGKTDFYSSRAWRDVRYEAIKRADGHCEACGRSPKDGVVLHADHVKPRSKYPHLALELANIQILCEDCNMGKSNRDETDWR